MNKDILRASLKGGQPKAAAMIVSALIAVTTLLGACGGGSDATATPANVPTQVPTTSASGAGTTSNSGTTANAGTTPEAGAGASATTTANGALSETEQAAQSSGITAGSVPSGTANVAVITSTQLVTGTEVVTNVQVSTNTAVIEQQLITQVITNTALVSNVVQNTQTSNATESSVTTQTAALTPETATGAAAPANVTITPIATPNAVVSNTTQAAATATPQSGQGATQTTTQTQIVTTTSAPAGTGKAFTGMTDAAGKTILGSTLLNSKFQTSDGNVTGKLDDLVVDLQTGQLLYLMLKYGGVLSVGDTTVAVPSNALSLKQDGELLLNIPPEDLKNFPSIKEDWPQAGNANWDADVRAFWQKEGFPVSFDTSLAGPRIRRTADWVGAPLNDTGIGGGTVQDEIISLEHGTVPYLLVSFANAPAANGNGGNGSTGNGSTGNGSTGNGSTGNATNGGVVSGTNAANGVGDNNWYAVPITAFDPQNPQLALRSNINATTFEGAPRFNRDGQGDNPFLPSNYDQDWANFWNKVTTPNQ